MRVVHFSHLLEGGAAVAALRLHSSLLARGVDSTFQSGMRGVSGLNLRGLEQWHGQARMPWIRIAGKVGRLFEKWSPRFQATQFFTQARQLYTTPIKLPDDEPVILHLHWISFLADYPSFFGSLPSNHPIVWTLHDLNPMTGGCHYTGGCDNFTTGCGRCPQLLHSGPDDVSRLNFAIKQRAVGRMTNLQVAGDSDWTTREGLRSPIFAGARSVKTVHYGLDDAVFRPHPQDEVRAALDIPAGAFVICTGAHQMGDRRKGWHVLVEALRSQPALSDAIILVFGNQAPGQDSLPQRIVSAGYTADEAKLARIYSAADVFAMPSLEEAFGQTALEAMSCGVPVVGSRVGGIPDIVLHNVTGLLAAPGDAVELGQMIAALRKNVASRSRMSAAGRRRVQQHFTLERQASEYTQLYTAALEV